MEAGYELRIDFRFVSHMIYLFMGQCKMQTADWLRTIVFRVRKQWDYCCHVLICMVKTIVRSLRFTLTDLFIDQAPVVQTLDSTIQWINHYPVDNAIVSCNTYLLDSAIQLLNNLGLITTKSGRAAQIESHGSYYILATHLQTKFRVI